MNVIYTTGSSSNSDNTYTTAPNAYVWYGTSPTAMTKKLKGETKRYEYNKYRADIHVVTMTALDDGVHYFYRVGDDKAPDGLSAILQFKHGPPKTWAVFGDYGLTNIERSLQSLLTAAKNGNEFDGVMHLGDIAYDLHNQNGQKGDIFMRSIEPITSGYPYMTIAGNHESTGNFTHYLNRFRSLESMGKKSGSDTMLWYSWNAPNVHFVGFDTEVYSYFNDPVQVARQLKWLEEDLIKANTATNRKKYPWIITLGHKCDWQDEVKFDDFRALFHKYGVDLHICGHAHNYQRLFPGLKRTVQTFPTPQYFTNPKYWSQIVVGSPGCQEKISHGLAPYKNGMANYAFAYGYGLLTVHNATTLEWRWKKTSEPESSFNGETLFDQAMFALQTEEMKAKSAAADEIADRMIIVQTDHGMRPDAAVYEGIMAENDHLDALEQQKFHRKMFREFLQQHSEGQNNLFGLKMGQGEEGEEETSAGYDHNDPIWAFQEMGKHPELRPRHDPTEEQH